MIRIITFMVFVGGSIVSAGYTETQCGTDYPKMILSATIWPVLAGARAAAYVWNPEAPAKKFIVCSPQQGDSK